MKKLSKNLIRKTKKICIIRSNPVSPDSRVEKEAYTLIKAGYNVHILAWDRESDKKEVSSYIKVENKEIPITRLGYKSTYGEGLKNLKSYLKFQFHMSKWLFFHKFHVIHACDFDTAFLSIFVAKIKKEKFIFDIFDFLYCEPNNIFEKIIKYIQIKLINNSDSTIICTEERKEQIKGSFPKNLTVIHNTPSLNQLSKSNIFIEKNKKIKIVYVGILQDYRLLKEITEVISENKNIEFHVGGFGKYESYFYRMSQRFANIKYYGKLTYSQTLSLEKQCDIMLAIYDPNIDNHKYAAPNKFYESLLLGKPVIMVKKTGMSYYCL